MSRVPNLNKPLLYLDTNIFLDLIRKRNPDSLELFQNIKRGKYKALTSTFTLLEIMEQEQERIYAEREIVHRKKSFDEVRIRINQRDLTEVELESIKIILNKEIFEPYVETEIIDLTYLDNEDWDRAFELQQKLNISSTDAIHLAMARIMDCDIFVTKDSYLRKIASKFFKPSVLIFSSSSEIDQKIEYLKKVKSEKHYRKKRN